jgi:hypothetical protein
MTVTACPNRTLPGVMWRLRGVCSGWPDTAPPEKANADAGTASIVIAMISSAMRIPRNINLGLKTEDLLCQSTGCLRG